MILRFKGCLISSYISDSSIKPCQYTQYCTWPCTQWLFIIFSTINKNLFCLSSSIAIWPLGHSWDGLRREVWITLYRPIQLGVCTLYICEPTFHLTMKRLIYFEVSIRLFPKLIVRFCRSTSTLLPELYDRALYKLTLLCLSFIYLRVL